MGRKTAIEFNRTLAMACLTMIAYEKRDWAEAIRRLSAKREWLDFQATADELARVLSAAGIPCMRIALGSGWLPDSVREAANTGHAVLIRLEPSAKNLHNEWVILEADDGNGLRVIALGVGGAQSPQGASIADSLTGDMVICTEVLPGWQGSKGGE